MLTNPHNHVHCQQYSEVKHTQGGLEYLELSRKCFAQALTLSSRNMRTLDLTSEQVIFLLTQKQVQMQKRTIC